MPLTLLCVRVGVTTLEERLVWVGCVNNQCISANDTLV